MLATENPEVLYALLKYKGDPNSKDKVRRATGDRRVRVRGLECVGGWLHG